MLFEKIKKVYVGCPLCKKELMFFIENDHNLNTKQITCPICNLDLPDETGTVITIARQYNLIIEKMEKIYEESDTVIFE